MIQRIQTLYLLLIVIAAVVLLWMPVLSFTTAEDAGLQRIATLTAVEGLQEQSLIEGVEFTPNPEAAPLTLNGTWGLIVTTALIALLALVDIFLYNKRLLQARLNIFLVCLCAGYYGVLFMYAWFAKMNLDMTWHVLPAAGIPLVCLVLTFMATRAILKDEALVRAADRIR
ncbi:MAG: DUF4293 domain-containing protein [Paludibacteraceae bacterium]|nr:DUF4293 domain-containing protein [Paludibacteraceae bacterium]